MGEITPNNSAIGPAVAQALGNTNTTLPRTQYSAEISRRNPTAFVFLIDQSGSMSNIVKFNGNEMELAKAAAIVINETLGNMIAACEKAGEIMHYFDVAVIGYGQKETADFVWEGELQGRKWVSSTELNQKPALTLTKQIQTSRGGVRELPIPAWFSPIHAGRTPMRSALKMAKELLQEWICAHPAAYPPVVMNITDGQATDADDDELLEAAGELRSLETTDGKVLLFNCHLSGTSNSSIVMPVEKRQLPDDKYAHLLFDMSSDLPPRYNRQIAEWRKEDLQTYTAMAYNATLNELFQLLEIGTRTAFSQVSK